MNLFIIKLYCHITIFEFVEIRKKKIFRNNIEIKIKNLITFVNIKFGLAEIKNKKLSNLKLNNTYMYR